MASSIKSSNPDVKRRNEDSYKQRNLENYSKSKVKSSSKYIPITRDCSYSIDDIGSTISTSNGNPKKGENGVEKNCLNATITEDWEGRSFDAQKF